jgi:hypothetical protein
MSDPTPDSFNSPADDERPEIVAAGEVLADSERDSDEARGVLEDLRRQTHPDGDRDGDGTALPASPDSEAAVRQPADDSQGPDEAAGYRGADRD